MLENLIKIKHQLGTSYFPSYPWNEQPSEKVINQVESLYAEKEIMEYVERMEMCCKFG